MKSSIIDVPGIEVGQAEDPEALTGCTVIRTPGGAVAGADVRGSAPGTRETDLLNPINLVEQVHAVCLTGGSAYGLEAATGVMRFLEEEGEGFDVGVGVVPIVPAAVLFDLSLGSARVRPDAAMGIEAARRAGKEPVAEGNVGAGCGASVGKFCGMEAAMKSGLGTASRRLANGLTVGALVAVNAVGEVRDPRTGETLAGARDGQGGFMDFIDCMARNDAGKNLPGTNTTLAVVASNARLTKARANKVAQMAHDGLARTIYPVHTMNDGDTVFALATGKVEAAVDVVGALSAEVLAEAVVRAVKAAAGAGGLPSHSEYKE
ncbi:L-aminopeptidase/D-esterase-like protein [Melghirimyces profundicolus]|uniref:L-aminopeptidase/D-esterase-like protein n=1 Tax=Melghirimyces profundicolus TaxID=1242148 RepID=A0A2T6C8K4_9BACL|nr:P1 family peptidase [Melghirimyces profundicolus]PTX64606.1 L-aminopeptidase/D-esterase-like protein [Melghirimyces profundicolus]